MNNYNELRPTQLSPWAANMGTKTVAAPALYATTLVKAQQILDTQELMNEQIVAMEAAKAAYRAAVSSVETARMDCLEAIRAVARDIYDGGVADNLVLEAGLVPRATTRTFHSPVQPTDLFADPNIFGGVDFVWSRNGNVGGTVFVIEWSLNNEDWNLVTTSTKVRATATGFAPGVTTYFRVTAQHNGQTSVPSNTAAIYLPTPSVNLQVAA